MSRGSVPLVPALPVLCFSLVLEGLGRKDLEQRNDPKASAPAQTEVPLDAEVILCCYRAVNAYYYKYAVDGINVFAVSILEPAAAPGSGQCHGLGGSELR